MSQLEHIQEGYAYHDGEERQLYSVDDPASAEAVFFAENYEISWSFGPLTVTVGASLNPPELSVNVTLLGVSLGSCTLTLQNPSCTVGGSVDGFKAELTLTLGTNPLSITIKGTLCAPFVGCKSFEKTITF